MEPDDWRLSGQCAYLTGVALVRRRYRRNPGNPAWDHDHCEFCNTKFTDEDDPDVLHEGYATHDDYRWICDVCFADFRSRFNWVVTADDEPSDAAEPSGMNKPRGGA